MQSPVTEETDLVSYTILVSGSAIDSSYQVTHIRVLKELNKVPSARITLLDGSPSQETFTISEGTDFVPGNEVEIKAGYHSKEATIFKGIIVKQIVKARQGAGSTLVVECRDKAVKSTIGRKSNYFQNTKDSDAISTAMGSYGLQLSVSSTTATIDEIIQYNATDWDFALTRAEVNSFVVVVDDGSVSYKAPNATQTPSLGVTYGDDILELNADLDAQSQLPSVTCNAWDMSSQALISAQSSEPSLNSQGNITGSALAQAIGTTAYNLQSSGAIAQDSLQAWANARLLKSRLSRIRGTVTFQGNATVKPDTVLGIDGVGARFDGTAYVTGVEHRIDGGNWVTEARFGMPDTWFASEPDIMEPAAAGLLPGIQGLYNGVVKQIDQDPANAFRILVTIPLIQSSSDGVWARLANFYATASAGSFFMPEVGDEVVLGFINDDPRYPVILGSLYSSAKTAPYTPESQNGTKAIYTKSKLIINFDDTNKVIQVTTPGGNKLILSDQDSGITIQDQNGNKAEFNSSGITINSASAMTLKAANSITISAPSISVSGDSSVSVKGASVSITADSSLSASGNASTSISSSGQTSISGSMVMIN